MFILVLVKLAVEAQQEYRLCHGSWLMLQSSVNIARLQIIIKSAANPCSALHVSRRPGPPTPLDPASSSAHTRPWMLRCQCSCQMWVCQGQPVGPCAASLKVSCPKMHPAAALGCPSALQPVCQAQHGAARTFGNSSSEFEASITLCVGHDKAPYFTLVCRSLSSTPDDHLPWQPCACPAGSSASVLWRRCEWARHIVSEAAPGPSPLPCNTGRPRASSSSVFLRAWGARQGSPVHDRHSTQQPSPSASTESTLSVAQT